MTTSFHPTATAAAAISALVFATGAPAHAQEQAAPTKPMTSRDQAQIYRHSIPTGWETEIYVTDAQGAERAQMLLDLYEILQTAPTIENVQPFLRPDYIQHSSMLPNGAPPLAMLFSTSVSQFPVKIDVYRIAIVGNFGMAHVNFRNLDNEDPEDLGIAAVDMYLWDENGLLAEHWDTLQEVPLYSANTNTEFLRLFEGAE
ncbi:MAG: hypothetical protein AAF667_01560 [Pseudomonadota bacterium]